MPRHFSVAVVAVLGLGLNFGLAPSSAQAQFRVPPFFERAFNGTLQPRDWVQGGGDVARGGMAIAGGVAGGIAGGPGGAIEGGAAGWVAGNEVRNGAYNVGGMMRQFEPQAPAPQPYPQPQPAPAGPLRFHYPEADGSPAVFVELGNGQWINHAHGQRYQFQQVARNDQQVILKDFSRNLTVMLNANGSKFWTVNGPWNGLGQGPGQWAR